MVVRRKPKTIEEFIGAGGLPPQSGSKPAEEINEKEIQSLKLRVPVELLKQVDLAVTRRRPSPSRHQWILEALYEKLERESANK
ncbi:MAG TPA: hypothetical protein VK141_04595 [Nitrosomonas sp.]|nr:hypothetical protein [Nitrosomonas sp.]